MNIPLTHDMIRSFQEAYRQDFGKNLPHDEAEAMATKLVDFSFFLAEILERRKVRLGHLASAKKPPEFDSPVVSLGSNAIADDQLRLF